MKASAPKLAALTLALFGVVSALPAGAWASTISQPAPDAISYTAAAGEGNELRIAEFGDVFVLLDNVPILDGDGVGGCSVIGLGVATCPQATSLDITLGDRDDVSCFITAADPVCPDPAGPDQDWRDRVSVESEFPTVATRIDAGAGDDRLHGGDGSDRLIGGPGDDRLFGHDGAYDLLEGDAGDDKLEPSASFRDWSCGWYCGGLHPEADDEGINTLDGGLGSDVFEVGRGYDIADYSSRTAAVQLDFGKGIKWPKMGEAKEGDSFVGYPDAVLTGSGDDRLVVSGAPNNAYHHDLPFMISTGAGNDSLKYMGTWDPYVFELGSGSDKFNGKQANPLTSAIYGGEGNDKIIGSWGDDTIDGGSGDDRILGINRNDTISGGSGRNLVRGGWGEDQIISSSDGIDRIFGEIGADEILAADGDDADYVSCGRGDFYEPILDPFPEVDLGDRVRSDCSDSK